ncbi:MAG: ABC transporter permease, partial [Limnohabitans sp.]
MPVLLLTDLFLFGLLAVVIGYAWRVRKDAHLRANWSLVFRRPVAMISAVVLGFFVLVALLDSVHYRPALASSQGQATAYASEPVSLLDQMLAPLVKARERSYS